MSDPLAAEIIKLCKDSYRQGGINALDSLTEGLAIAKALGLTFDIADAIAATRNAISTDPNLAAAGHAHDEFCALGCQR